MGSETVGRIVIEKNGGPEELHWQQVELGEPGPNEVRVRHTAVGMNFIDVYFRTGLYAGSGFPLPLGSEAAGVVEAVGSGVTELRVGDRVAYGSGPLGAYSEARLISAHHVVRVPDGIADDVAAAIMLKGMTAEYLLHRTVTVHAGDTVLVHAAAGGVGLLLCQWAKHLGVRVLGTVGNDEKAALALAHGCDASIVYGREDVAKHVRELTSGKGVRVVYDSVGKDTFQASLDSLAPRGMLVLFGQSSGKVAPFDPQLLAAKGSLFFTRPTLGHYIATRAELVESAGRVFAAVAEGTLKINIGQRFALKDAAKAHTELEARRTTGATVLSP
ncbi:MAG TPA: quinone oxidoreductase [Polyangiaceae bacterium]|jgi:NADPH2:quinone reductase|nr:quinone oxidoreductase [Polyangiaceae bacterium]